ncbi:MAG: methionyl-tRNA formyltransferase [Armatimonadota bacterium]
MRILFFGTSVFALPILRAFLEQGYPVVGVVTQPDRPAGRGGKLTSPPVKTLAVTAELPVLQPESCRTPEFLNEVRALAPELIVVAAYGQFLPDTLLRLPAHGAVNLHGSLLPKYRGAAPIARAIWNGETHTGVCLMWMARAMDAGDVIDCRETPISPDDTTGTLTERLAEMAAELLMAWLPALAHDEAPRKPQRVDDVTYAPMISKGERSVDWSMSAEAIWRQIRALAPSPAAVTFFRGMPVKLLEAIPAEHFSSTPQEESGEIKEKLSKTGLFVTTGAGVLEVRSLQPAGKRPMSGVEFLRGHRPTAGERFTPNPSSPQDERGCG